MISIYKTLILLCYLSSISTTIITIYKNAQFHPLDNQSMVYNYSSILSRDICICRCFMNSMCNTATYIGSYQYCLLYFAHIQEGQLQVVSSNINSDVISLKNMNYADSTSSSIPLTEGISTYAYTQTTSQAITTAIDSSSSFPSLSTTLSKLTTITIATTVAATCTTFITFDDIPYQSSTSGIIPNGYKNLNWTNAEYINVSTVSTPSGYMRGGRTQPFVMHNPTTDIITISSTNGTRFSFDNLYLTSAWRDSLNVTMKTMRNGTITSSGLYSAMTAYATFIYCNFCTNIDTIILQGSGGIPRVNYTQNGTQLIIDNLCISFGH